MRPIALAWRAEPAEDMTLDPPPSLQPLQQLFVHLFDTHELRRFMAEYSLDKSMATEASLVNLAEQAASLLARNGLLNIKMFEVSAESDDS